MTALRVAGRGGSVEQDASGACAGALREHSASDLQAAGAEAHKRATGFRDLVGLCHSRPSGQVFGR